jgi:hypothetical protein
MEIITADSQFTLTGGHLSFDSQITAGGPFCPAVSSVDGDLYVQSNTGEIRRYDIDTLTQKGTITHDTRGLNFVFDPAGDIVVATSVCDISRVSVANGSGSALASNSQGPWCQFSIIAMQWSPASRNTLCVLVANSLFDLFEHAILTFDGATGQQLNNLIPFSVPTDPHKLNWTSSYFCFGPDGNIYAPNMNHDVNRFDGKTGAFIDTFIDGSTIPSDIRHLIFTPNGTRLYVTVAGLLLEYDVSTRKNTRVIGLSSTMPAFSAWITSEWVEKQVLLGGLTQVPSSSPGPAARIPKFEWPTPNWPVSPLDVLADLWRGASQPGNAQRGAESDNRARDAVVKYGLGALGRMLSDPSEAGKVRQALADALGAGVEDDLRALLKMKKKK